MKDKKNVLEEEERVFTIRDCIDLFKRKQKKVFQFSLFCGCLVFGFLLLKVPQYRVESTFKEGAEKEGTGGLKELLGNLGSTKVDSQMIILMKSHPVLKSLISKMGLQASVSERGRLSQYYRSIRDNLRANSGKPLEDLDPFLFSDLIYEGLEGLSFFLRFTDREHFTLLLSDKTVVAEGKVGCEIAIENLQSPLRFTLNQIPKNLRLYRDYPLAISPWFSLIGQLSSNLMIVPHKLNKSVLELSYTSRDRYLATKILANWMDSYLEYLKKDHDEIDKSQMGYLEQRQEQLYSHLSHAFDEYGIYLSENLKKSGLMGLEQEMKRILEPLHGISERVLLIDLELSLLNQAEKEGVVGLLTNENVKEKAEELQMLQQQRDLLSISIEDRHAPLIAQHRLEDLKELRSQKRALEELRAQVENKASITGHFDFEPEQALAQWAGSLAPNNEQERKDFSGYLEQYLRILGVKEKIEESRFFHPQEHVDELEGIDLETAKSLFVAYNRKFDDSERTCRHLEFLKKELRREDFEIGSLSAVLIDSMSQMLIKQASETVLFLKDEKHRTGKEKERWQEELTLQKSILSDHLDQLLKVEELNSSLIREKIDGLRYMMLDCINQKISVIQTGFYDFIKERKKTILNEKKLLEEKAKELRAHAAVLPESWRQEKWLNLKIGFSTKMMSAITELVEAKTIGHHLYRIDSKPLNCPILPSLAVVPRLYFKSFAAAAAGGMAFFFVVLLGTIFKGFPTSPDKLKAMKLPFLGEVSPFCDGKISESLIGPDLELLRQIALFLKKPPEHKVIGLIAGKGPDYSYALAQNLARMSRRSLVLRCDFASSFHISEQPGLLQFLQGDVSTLPIRQQNGFDYMTSGGYTPYGNEWIQSQVFKELLHRMKQEYDYVFLLLRSHLSASESVGALNFCDRAIVTVCGEATELLTPFTSWGYEGDHQRIMFIASRGP